MEDPHPPFRDVRLLSDILPQALWLFRRRWGVLVASVAILMAVSLPIQLAASLGLSGAQIILQGVGAVVSSILLLGFWRIIIDIIGGNQPGLRDLLSYGHLWLKAGLVGLLLLGISLGLDELREPALASLKVQSNIVALLGGVVFTALSILLMVIGVLWPAYVVVFGRDPLRALGDSVGFVASNVKVTAKLVALGFAVLLAGVILGVLATGFVVDVWGLPKDMPVLSWLMWLLSLVIYPIWLLAAGLVFLHLTEAQVPSAADHSEAYKV